MKTAVIYYSKHHGNTKKVLDAIAGKHEIVLINAAEPFGGTLDEYGAIGFASGIYYSKFHKSVLKFANEHLPSGKKVFFIYTYGAKKDGYTKAIRESVMQKNAEFLGEYGCFGFNTFGPFKLIGGIAKGRPNDDDLKGASEFYESICG